MGSSFGDIEKRNFQARTAVATEQIAAQMTVQTQLLQYIADALYRLEVRSGTSAAATHAERYLSAHACM